MTEQESAFGRNQEDIPPADSDREFQLIRSRKLRSKVKNFIRKQKKLKNIQKPVDIDEFTPYSNMHRGSLALFAVQQSHVDLIANQGRPCFEAFALCDFMQD